MFNPKYKNVFFAPGGEITGPQDDVVLSDPSDVIPKDIFSRGKAKTKSKSLYEALYKYVKETTGYAPTETNIVHLVDMLLENNIEEVTDDKDSEDLDPGSVKPPVAEEDPGSK